MKYVLAALAALSLASAAHASPKVEAAWTRPAAQGQTGAGFMVLRNPDAKPDALVSVASPVARTVQIHQSSMSGGMASMKPVTRVELPAGGAVTFAPGGYHLMLMGLSKAVKVGDAVPATLIFASGAKVQTTLVAGMSPPDATEHHH